MAKTKQVTEKFSIGQNTYEVGEVKSFSDELAKKHENNLADPIPKPKVTRKNKKEE